MTNNRCARRQFVSICWARARVELENIGSRGQSAIYFGRDRGVARISRLYSIALGVSHKKCLKGPGLYSARSTLMEGYLKYPPRPDWMYAIGSYISRGAGCHDNGDHV
eukprot:6172261-Pleurochrysis_carterae.AAC.1